MVYVRRDGGRYQVAIMDFATRQTQVLTPGPLDESPSVAPNGRLVLYANETGGRGILNAVSADGRVKQRIVAPATDVREPAWGPLPR
jgi:TolB protein